MELNEIIFSGKKETWNGEVWNRMERNGIEWKTIKQLTNSLYVMTNCPIRIQYQFFLINLLI
jgi:hypothetical protein